MANDKITSPIKAIRAKCLDCCCGSSNEVKLCPCAGCALYPFRFGKSPYYSKRKITDEQKAKLLAQLSKARSARKLTTKNAPELK